METFRNVMPPTDYMYNLQVIAIYWGERVFLRKIKISFRIRISSLCNLFVIYDYLSLEVSNLFHGKTARRQCKMIRKSLHATSFARAVSVQTCDH